MLHSRLFLLIACSAVLLTCAVWGRVLRVSYIGCFVDKSDRDLNGLAGITAIGAESVHKEKTTNSDMTIEFCSDFCSVGGFNYFGLQGQKQCFCGWSYGRHGKSNETDCNRPCLGNSSQMCGGNWRNSVFSLTYPKMSCFKQSKMPNLTVSSTLPTYWSLAAQTALDCLILCEASAYCQAVIFSGQQRLCHLLRFAYPPASLSSTDGDYFVRG
uniref:WSC domain-containing protein n=1 Tax=Macrostomum lignano TaxID=282301 RepID=A0A1I8HX25_9PLAT